MLTRVSRGMLTTEAFFRSADTWSSICTSASGVLPTLFFEPPSLRFSLLFRLSEPISRMFSGVWPAAFGAFFFAALLPALRSPLRRLLFRCSYQR